MRFSSIHDLLESDSKAREYFDTLPANLREGLMAHGSGINDLEELEHFADIIRERGGRP